MTWSFGLCDNRGPRSIFSFRFPRALDGASPILPQSRLFVGALPNKRGQPPEREGSSTVSFDATPCPRMHLHSNKEPHPPPVSVRNSREMAQPADAPRPTPTLLDTGVFRRANRYFAPIEYAKADVATSSCVTRTRTPAPAAVSKLLRRSGFAHVERDPSATKAAHDAVEARICASKKSSSAPRDRVRSARRYRVHRERENAEVALGHKNESPYRKGRLRDRFACTATRKAVPPERRNQRRVHTPFWRSSPRESRPSIGA